jgi:hypothetical protein
MTLDGRKVAPDSTAEILRLPDVDRLTLPILHEVDARLPRKPTQYILPDMHEVLRHLLEIAVAPVLEGQRVIYGFRTELETELIQKADQYFRCRLSVVEGAVTPLHLDAVKIDEAREPFRAKSRKQATGEAQRA